MLLFSCIQFEALKRNFKYNSVSMDQKLSQQNSLKQKKEPNHNKKLELFHFLKTPYNFRKNNTL